MKLCCNTFGGPCIYQTYNIIIKYQTKREKYVNLCSMQTKFIKYTTCSSYSLIWQHKIKSVIIVTKFFRVGMNIIARSAAKFVGYLIDYFQFKYRWFLFIGTVIRKCLKEYQRP